MVVIPQEILIWLADSEAGRAKDEGPVHQVNVAAFAMARREHPSQFAAFVKKTNTARDKCWTHKDGKVEERSGNCANLATYK